MRARARTFDERVLDLRTGPWAIGILYDRR